MKNLMEIDSIRTISPIRFVSDEMVMSNFCVIRGPQVMAALCFCPAFSASGGWKTQWADGAFNGERIVKEVASG